MNPLDICVAAVFIICVFSGYARGLVLSLYSVCGWILSLWLARQFYPYVNEYMQNGFVYDWVYSLVSSNLDIEAVVAEHGMAAQSEIISSLNLPAFITELLQSGNNPVLYELFKATDIASYIYGYLAAICVNILAMAAAFVLISIIMKIVLQCLDVVTRLPVIHTMNRLGGALAGAVQGLLIVWVSGVLITMLTAAGAAPWLAEMLAEAPAARWFVENNLLMGIVLRLTDVKM